MAFADRINESIRGRNLGFEFLSSGKHGTTKTGKLLVGPETIRERYSTAETTSVNLAAIGLTGFGTTSTGAGSSAVYTLDPPIPGTPPKIIALSCGASDGPVYFKAGSGITISNTAGTTWGTIKFSTLGMIKLFPLTTARWFTDLTTGTSSQGMNPTLQETT
jgi:hypothetical protein